MSTIRDEKHRRLDELSVRASRAFVDSGLHGTAAEVVIALDLSPAMAPLFANGFVQELTTALLALAMKFDDNGRVPLWTFSEEAFHVGEIRQQDYRGWVDRNVPAPRMVPGIGIMPTRFAPLIDAVARRYFPAEWEAAPTQRRVGDKLKRTVLEYATVNEPRPCPVFVLVVTSGDCDDLLETTKLLRKSSWLPIFWQFAGVDTSHGKNPGDFRFLKGIDKLSDSWVDNCGFFLPQVDPLPEDESAPTKSGLVKRVRFELGEENLYAGLLNEFPRYLAHERVAPMLLAPAPTEQPGSDTGDRLDGLLMALPDKEAARREKERLEREQRRVERAALAAAELERAAAWPRIKAQAEAEVPVESEAEEPIIRQRGDGPRRVHQETRPYQPEDGPVPRIPTRRPTVSFSTFEAAPEPEEDENTVETAAERLARIRARRNARKTSPS